MKTSRINSTFSAQTECYYSTKKMHPKEMWQNFGAVIDRGDSSPPKHKEGFRRAYRSLLCNQIYHSPINSNCKQVEDRGCTTQNITRCPHVAQHRSKRPFSTDLKGEFIHCRNIITIICNYSTIILCAKIVCIAFSPS